jgi:hypothetical protein
VEGFPTRGAVKKLVVGAVELWRGICCANLLAAKGQRITSGCQDTNGSWVAMKKMHDNILPLLVFLPQERGFDDGT